MKMEKKRKGRSNCCVQSCKNTFSNTTAEIKFFKFPTCRYKIAQREEWKHWIRKTKPPKTHCNGFNYHYSGLPAVLLPNSLFKYLIHSATPDWEPTRYSRICSTHFIGNCTSPILRNPGYAPSIVTRNNLEMHPNEKSAIERFDRFMKRRMERINRDKGYVNVKNEETSNLEDLSKPFRFTEISEPNELPAVRLQVNKQIQVDVFETIREHNNPVSGITTFICNQYVRNNVCEAQTQAYISKNPADSSIVVDNNKHCSPHILQDRKAVGPDYPGFDNCATGFCGISSIRTDQEMFDLCGVTLSTFNTLLKEITDNKFKKVSKENRLLIFLTKMKMGLSFRSISLMFRVHRTTASRIFLGVLKLLRASYDPVIRWPSREVVQSTMPKDFKKMYGDCRVIIDCTEIKLEQPSYLQSRVYTYSYYIKTSNAKILVGCTPDGLITFLSPCYCGKTSDCEVVIESGILSLLEPGDVVLADENFSGIQKVLDEDGTGKLIVIPPLLRDSQFIDKKVDTTYQVTRTRRHIDQIMQRFRAYKILNKISVDLLPYTDSIIIVCGILANMQPPIPTFQCKATQC